MASGDRGRRLGVAVPDRRHEPAVLGDRAGTDLGAEGLGLEAEADLRADLPAERLEVDVVRRARDRRMQSLVGRP